MWFTDWFVPLVSLTAMEIVLGVDNIVFIAIVAGSLPPERQEWARRSGLLLALIMRLLLLLTLSWVIGLTDPVFKLSDIGVPAAWLTQPTNEISWRDVILIGGGLFLIGKSAHEIRKSLRGAEGAVSAAKAQSMGRAVAQIALLDLVFSLDSLITAVGIARQIWVMATAILLAMGVMLAFAGRISDFIHQNPRLKTLALSFLVLIGVMLVADGIDKHIQRGTIYFAMLFALSVELLNLQAQKKHAVARGGREAATQESTSPGRENEGNPDVLSG
jgi:predicted tellurium resistance membrane protein TerC